VEVNVRDDCVGDNSLPSIAKIDPMVFTFYEKKYFKVGQLVSPAFEPYKTIGRKQRHR
jgi:hypothetical protein